MSKSGEIVQGVIDSSVTTKAVNLVGVGGMADSIWFGVLPDLMSMAGGVIAGVAGVYLIMRHNSQRKLNDLQAEKTRIEIDNLKREGCGCD